MPGRRAGYVPLSGDAYNSAPSTSEKAGNQGHPRAVHHAPGTQAFWGPGEPGAWIQSFRPQPEHNARTSTSTLTKEKASKALGSNAAPQAIRQRDKFVPLPSTGGKSEEDTEPEDQASSLPSEALVSPRAGELADTVEQQLILPSQRAAPEPARGRITVYCIAESLHRKTLETLLPQQYKQAPIAFHDEVIHLRLKGPRPLTSAQQRQQIQQYQQQPQQQILGFQQQPQPPQDQQDQQNEHQHYGLPGNSPHHQQVIAQDVFFFDYGVIVCFGLEEQEEREVVQGIGRMAERGPYVPAEVEIDRFIFNSCINEPPHIINDCVTLNRKLINNADVRLSISHALAQSTKLSVYEERVWDLVQETKHLPECLALHGKVPISTKAVAQLIGKVFLQNANVNLLSSVLDTPDWFWHCEDVLQALYERMCEYLELETRVEVLNGRFQVLQEMLDMLRDHQNNWHAARLEWIIIWLLLVDCVLMLFQLLSLFGLVGRK